MENLQDFIYVNMRDYLHFQDLYALASTNMFHYLLIQNLLPPNSILLKNFTVKSRLSWKFQNNRVELTIYSTSFHQLMKEYHKNFPIHLREKPFSEFVLTLPSHSRFHDDNDDDVASPYCHHHRHKHFLVRTKWNHFRVARMIGLFENSVSIKYCRSEQIEEIELGSNRLYSYHHKEELQSASSLTFYETICRTKQRLDDLQYLLETVPQLQGVAHIQDHKQELEEYVEENKHYLPVV